MRLLSYGRAALLVELGSLEAAVRLAADLETDRPAGVSELVPGARTVLVRFDPAGTDRATLGAELARRPRAARTPDRTADVGTADPPDAAGAVELAVRYDGPDLAEVARLTGMSAAEVVDRHCAAGYVVAFTGFAPGFGYLSGGDPALVVPRRSSPRTRVAAGAVGLAGEFTGIYPRPGPGGWQLIGRTDTTMWDLDRTPAALLRPGVRVRFRAVGT